MSKGSQQRPVNKKKFDESWERIFGKKVEKVRSRCATCGELNRKCFEGKGCVK